jgi:hypothetical protein
MLQHVITYIVSVFVRNAFILSTGCSFACVDVCIVNVFVKTII